MEQQKSNWSSNRMEIRYLILLFWTFLPAILALSSSSSQELRVFTVATEATDGFERFNRSVNIYGIKVDVLGMGKTWKGGDIARFPGGGQKVNLLKDAVKSVKDDNNIIVMFTDSYDVIFTTGSKDILETFKSFKADVVFSAEVSCWPDESLSVKYPKLENSGKPYLNSGGFIGYAPVVFDMINSGDIGDADDDQLFYTKIFLNETLRKKFGIKLDSTSKIFQNLNGAFGETQLKFESDDTRVENIMYNTNPIVIHGNGPNKLHLNGIGNYLAKSWAEGKGCRDCVTLEEKGNIAYEHLLIGIFIEVPTPFLEEFFEDVFHLEIDKRNTSVIIHNAVKFHDNLVKDFVKNAASAFRNVKLSDVVEEWQARSMTMEECLILGCDYYLSLDSTARLTNPQAVTNLMRQKKKIIAPVLTRPKKLWSNFWGSLSYEGYYARSFDYLDIVNNKRRGVWNVPYIAQAYLINGQLIKQGLYSHPSGSNAIPDSSGKTEMSQMNHNSAYPSFTASPTGLSYDAEMSFSYSLRKAGLFMYVSNLHDYGHLVDPENYDTTRVNSDFYELYHNQLDWERRYIHPDYERMFTDNDSVIQQPCPDVYWFPLVKDIFCDQLIQIMESYGKWSAGNNRDERLATGYENVPTRDIHMNQVGLESQWLFFLREYIRPVQEKVFTGYYHDPPKAIMNFVVRYRPDEQPSLRPHHDSSTYTINIALNQPGIDYEGGGCRFLRYNCSVTNLRKGWTLMHPGRLTHYHEGLPVTKGTRYIMISFVDP